jgi:hypothetical protein
MILFNTSLIRATFNSGLTSKKGILIQATDTLYSVIRQPQVVRYVKFTSEDLEGFFGFKGAFVFPTDNSLEIPQDIKNIIQGYVDNYYAYFQRNAMNPRHKPVRFIGHGHISYNVCTAFALGAYSSVTNNSGRLRGMRVGGLFEIQVLSVIMAYSYIFACGVTIKHVIKDMDDGIITRIGISHVHMCHYFVDLIRNINFDEATHVIPAGGSTMRMASHRYKYHGTYELADWMQSKDVNYHITNIVSILTQFDDLSEREGNIIRQFVKTIFNGDDLTDGNVYGLSTTQLNNVNAKIAVLRSNNALPTSSLFSSRVDKDNILNLRKAFNAGSLCYTMMGREIPLLTRDCDFGISPIQFDRLFPIGKQYRIKYNSNPYTCGYYLNNTPYIPGAYDVFTRFIGNYIELVTPLSELEAFGASLNQFTTEVDDSPTMNFSAQSAFVLKYIFGIEFRLLETNGVPDRAKTSAKRKFTYQYPSTGGGLVMNEGITSNILPTFPFTGFDKGVTPPTNQTGGNSGLPNDNQVLSEEGDQTDVVPKETQTKSVSKNVQSSLTEKPKTATSETSETETGETGQEALAGKTPEGDSVGDNTAAPFIGMRIPNCSYRKIILNCNGFDEFEPDNKTKQDIDEEFFSEVKNISKYNLKRLIKLREKNPVLKESLYDIRDRYERLGLTMNDYVNNRKLFPVKTKTLEKKITLVQERNLESYNFSFRLSVDNTHMPYQINGRIHYEDRIPELMEFIEIFCKISMAIPPIFQIDKSDIINYISAIGYPFQPYIEIQHYEVNSYNKFFRGFNDFKAKSLQDISVVTTLKENLKILKINKTERFNNKLIYNTQGVTLLAVIHRGVFQCMFQKYKGNIQPIQVEIVSFDELQLVYNRLCQVKPPFIYIQYDDVIAFIIYKKTYFRKDINERTIVTANIKIMLCDNNKYDDDDGI